MKKVDIVIIGSGMAGISAAVYLKRANANFVLLEGNMAGGMLNQLKSVENYPAMPNTTGADILIALMDQLRFNEIPVVYGNVQTILKEGDGFEVITDVESYDANAVIVATGMSQSSKTIPGEEKYSGQGVSYCATCDGNFFKGLDVAVYGNNDIALEEALYLSNLASKVYFVTKEKELFGDELLIKQLKEKVNVIFKYNETILEIRGDLYGVNEILLNNETINYHPN